MSDINAELQPTTIVSMKRNLSYYTDVESDVPEVVFSAMGVIRDSGESDIDRSDLYRVASNVMTLWYTEAINFYEGERIYNDEVEISTSARQSAPYVTVYGDIIDKMGRSFTLTVTDQSTRESVKDMVTPLQGLWDWATETLSFGDNNNHKGVSKYGTVLGVDIGKKSKKSKKSTGNKKPSNNSESTYCETFDMVKGLPENSVFTMPVATARITNDKLIFVGFTTSIDGKYKPHDESCFLYEKDMSGNVRKGFIEFKLLLEQSGDDYSADFEFGECTVVARKMISKKNNAYYTDVELLK